MCYNIVQYHGFSCNLDHYVVVKRQMVDCNRKRCRLSCMHEAAVHDCASTCAQRMLPDQRIITDTRNIKCSRCAGMTNGH